MLIHLSSFLARTQCVKTPIFVQKFKLMKTRSKWSIRTLLAKLTTFDGKIF